MSETINGIFINKSDIKLNDSKMKSEFSPAQNDNIFEEQAKTTNNTDIKNMPTSANLSEDKNLTYLDELNDMEEFDEAEDYEPLTVSKQKGKTSSKEVISKFCDNIDISKAIEDLFFEYKTAAASDKKTDVSGSTVTTTEALEGGGEIVTVSEHLQNGVEKVCKEIRNSDGKVIQTLEKTDDANHNHNSLIITKYNDKGKPEKIVVETDNKGNITNLKGVKYSYDEYLHNTSDPTSTLTLENHLENKKITLIQHVSSGELDIKENVNDTETLTTYDKNGIKKSSEITVENENGTDIKTYNGADKLVSERKFTPGASSSTENIGYGNEGDYVSYVFDENERATVSYGLHIDKNGSRTSFGEEEKITGAVEVNYGLDFDNEISGTKQGKAGDCWLLSGINSLSYNEKGRQIIDDALEYKNDKVTVHTYFGDYDVSYEEVQKAKTEQIDFDSNGKIARDLKYASGDDDIVVLELAIEKLRSDVASGKFKMKETDFSEDYLDTGYSPISENRLFSGLQTEAAYYLTGNKGSVAKDAESKHNLLDMYSQNKENSISEIGLMDDTKFRDENGNIIELIDNHAYAVKDVNENFITITNPWDSAKDIIINRSDLENADARIGYTDLSVIEKENGIRLPD